MKPSRRKAAAIAAARATAYRASFATMAWYASCAIYNSDGPSQADACVLGEIPHAR